MTRNGAEGYPDGAEKQVQYAIPTPRALYKYLDEHVIGQEDAKRTLSVAIYNHYKRCLLNMTTLYDENNPLYEKELADVDIDKSNVMLVGNTGTGKTYMVRNLARLLNIPFYISDATKFTETGYVGADVESILSGLLREADGNLERAQWGIVCIDEIDKIARKGENTSITRDVSGEGVQQGLLKIVEGGLIQMSPNGGRIHPDKPLLEMDTTNILFIGTGAFDGLERIIGRRLNTNSVGFDTNRRTKGDKNLLSDIRSEDMVAFGMIPELVGRFPTMTHTNDLTEEDLVKILTEPRNAVLKQYRKMFAVDGVKLTFSDDALKYVAKAALKHKTGARGLRRILDGILSDLMFEYGGNDSIKELTVTEDMVSEIINKDKKNKVA